jgi:hypothetical protein
MIIGICSSEGDTMNAVFGKEMMNGERIVQSVTIRRYIYLESVYDIPRKALSFLRRANVGGHDWSRDTERR